MSRGVGRPAVCAAAFAVCTALVAPAAGAQDRGRVDVSGGVRWTGSFPFAPVAATETALAGTRRTLFQTSTDLDAAIGGELRGAVRLGGVFAVEGAVALSRPQLTTRVTADVEGAADTTATESISQYVFEGGVRLDLARWRVGTLAPFATAGAGSVRQLHDGHTLVETGQLYYVGGGVTYALTSRPGRAIKATGLRGDVRAAFLSGGVALDDGRHVAPSLSASFFVSF